MDIPRHARQLLVTLVSLLLALLLAPPLPSAAAPDEGTHDAFHATVRLPGHGRCTLSKSDAQVRARVACRDGWQRRVRRCPQEDSRHCFWHAPSRGNGVGRSFLVLEGVRRYFPG